MSNIHTLRDIEQQENATPLPNTWASSRNEPTVESYRPSGHYRIGFVPQFAYIDMNGEPKMAPMGTNTGKALCLMCCPCFVDPCGRERRKEYKKSLRSFTLPMCFIQIAMLIVALALGGVVPLSQNPAVGPGANTFILLGAKDTLLIQQGQVFRFITPVFLHAGIFHLLVNVLAEWRFGLYVERKWGTLRYVVIYFLAAIGATIMSCLLNPTAISVGASGALMGLLGAYLADILMSW
jgi:membrane associated rhomboid family serine protease